ncbi:L-lactate MFS transporter [Dictyobacter aurantiacus]|uniref:MFS transporter n=1 Tax=Dictyobacter aurantiacus TaxID=1936993 RepID=A0A401ZML0_9CHLR|nr:OFA family MFS transporter [Dictyobacter aurantiacus]GCE08088.1 MFS transporter [Dictyobacter aurantiacus]
MSSASPGTLRQPNRWLIAIAAFVLQLALGSVYAWSVFSKPIAALFNGIPASKVTAAQLSPISLTFSITLLALGVTAAFGGYLQLRYGPRVIATAGGILYGLGIVLAGLTLSSHNVYLLYLTFGIIGGIGIGLGYIVPLAMLLRWFPDRRGFITGLAVAGFGLGALLIAQTVPPLLLPKSIGVASTFIYLGIIYLIVVVGAAQFFRRAPDNYVPEGWSPSTTVQAEMNANRDYTFGEALRTPRWYVLWLTLALNVTAGAALIAVASPLAQKFTGVDPITAGVFVSTISVFNGLGRLAWAWLSDAIGRPFTFLAIFVVQILAFLFLAQIGAGGFALLLIPGALIGLCYGGGFGTMPAFAADFFGAKYSGTIYGAMLTAWSAGGIVGPILISNMEYHAAIYVIIVILAVSCALPLLARFLNQRQRNDAVEVVAGKKA